jgi:hypothetical protein
MKEPSDLDRLLEMMLRSGWKEGPVIPEYDVTVADFQVLPGSPRPANDPLRCNTVVLIGPELHLYFDVVGNLIIHATFPEQAGT